MHRNDCCSFAGDFSSINDVSIQKVSLQSTNTGTAPISQIAPTVATKVLAAVSTSSPGLTPPAFKLNLMASVPELTPSAYLVPISCENLDSNSASGLPRVKSQFLQNLLVESTNHHNYQIAGVSKNSGHAF